MISRLLHLVLIVIVCGVSFAQPQAGRTVAVGDVHGSLDEFTAILQKAELIDGTKRWTGGRSVLVLLGDLIDRGPRSRDVLDFTMTLQKEAQDRGGNVRVGLGNHEVMNIMGDLRYLVPQDYAAFTVSSSSEKRERAFTDYARLQTRKGRTADRTSWMNAHPLGFIEHREAFAVQGKYGKWLRSLPAVQKVGNVLFMHGGLDPDLKTSSVEQINNAVAAELQAFDRITRRMIDRGSALPFFTLDEMVETSRREIDELKAKPEGLRTVEDQEYAQMLQAFLGLGNWVTIHPNGPLWYRGYDSWPESDGPARLASVMKTFGVQHIVVAHTIQPGGIRMRFGGLVFLIDTAMYMGTPAALEFSNGRARAIYKDRQLPLN
jgi:hypothetical protein